MSERKHPYPPAFRRQMVELARAGRTPEELSREFEPTARTVGGIFIAWVTTVPPAAVMPAG